MALNVGARGGEVRRRRLAGHKQQLHQPPGRVIDVDQQRARRRPVLEPAVVAAIDLDQLAEAGAAVPRLVHLGRAQLPGDPEAGVDHDPAHRLGGQVDAMALAQLLGRQRRAEVGVAVADQAAHAGFQPGRELAVAVTATLARTQAARAVLAVAQHQTFHLTPRQAEFLGRAPDRQAMVDYGLNHLEPIEFAHRHRDGLGHAHRGLPVSDGRKAASMPAWAAGYDISIWLKYDITIWV
ncbi:hypothetical protein D9M70_508840 [compost metagenome]